MDDAKEPAARLSDLLGLSDRCKEPTGEPRMLRVDEAGAYYWVRVCRHGIPVVWTPSFSSPR